MLLKLTKNINFNLKFMFGYAGLFFITFIFVLMAFGILSLKKSDNEKYAYLTYNENYNDYFNKIKICDPDIKIDSFNKFEFCDSYMVVIEVHGLIIFFISLLSLTSVFYMPSLFNDFNVIKKHNLSSTHPCELSKISNNILYWHIALFQFIMSAWLIPIVYALFYTGFSWFLIIVLLMYLISVLFSSLIIVAVKINCINFVDKSTDRLIEEHRNDCEQNIILGGVYFFITVCVYSFLLVNCISYFSNKSTFLWGNFEHEVYYYCIAYISIISIMSCFTYFKYIKNQHIEYLKYLTSNIKEFEKYYNHKFINLRINLVMIFGYITIFYLPLLIVLNSMPYLLFYLFLCGSLTIIMHPVSIKDGIIILLLITASIVSVPDLSLILLMFKYIFILYILSFFVWRVAINKNPMSNINGIIIIILTYLMFFIIQVFLLKI